MRGVVVVVVLIAAVVAWRLIPREHAAQVVAVPHAPPTVGDRPKPRPPRPIDAAVAPSAITRLEIPGSDRFDDLIVVGDRLVWTDAQGSIYTMPSRGGRARELANQHDLEQLAMYGALAARRGTVYAAREGAIVTVGLPDGPVTPVPGWGSDGDAYELASDGDSLYAALMTGEITRAADDGSRTILMRAYQGQLAIGSAGTYVADFSLGTIAKLAPKPHVIARGIPMLAGFAVAGGIGYAWSQQDFLVHRVELATGKVTALWPDKLEAGRLLADGDWLYTFTDDNALVRIASDGHELQRLAEHVAESPLASDADAVYVGQVDGNAILRIDKARVAPLTVAHPATVAR